VVKKEQVALIHVAHKLVEVGIDYIIDMERDKIFQKGK
jgi:hypothetical protein